MVIRPCQVQCNRGSSCVQRTPEGRFQCKIRDEVGVLSSGGVRYAIWGPQSGQGCHGKADFEGTWERCLRREEKGEETLECHLRAWLFAQFVLFNTHGCNPSCTTPGTCMALCSLVFSAWRALVIGGRVPWSFRLLICKMG